MDTFALENFIDFCDDMEIAQEGIISGDTKMGVSMFFSQDRKSAKGLMKGARQSYKSGDYAQAISLATKALTIWKSMRKTASKIPDKQAGPHFKYSDGSDTYKGISKRDILAGIDQEISTINAFIYKCQQAAKKGR